MTADEVDLLYDLAEACYSGDMDALERAGLTVTTLDHAPLCPQRVGGECLCVKGELTAALDLHGLAP
jgi:hypothetical protein